MASSLIAKGTDDDDPTISATQSYTSLSSLLPRDDTVINDIPAIQTPVTADEALLAQLGYKQEFLRAFSPLEVFGQVNKSFRRRWQYPDYNLRIAFSIIGLLPSIASVLVYAIPNGGPVSMVWGWAVCSIFILFIGMAMAELASAAPTSGGLYYWTHSLSSPRWRNLLCWIVGYANTVGTIAAVASINWGCSVQIMAAVSIATDGSFSSTKAQDFGTYALIVLSHAIVCSLGTRLLARLQTVYVILNVILCLAVIIALPAATPAEFKNDPAFAFGRFYNSSGWPDWYSFILSWIAPAWTICSFDSSVHISEEATNAATAVPWAIVSAIFIAGILGWGAIFSLWPPSATTGWLTMQKGINVAIAFCMGQNLDDILGNAYDQPMATIFANSFGPNGTLALWAIVVIVQYMMGSSMLLASSRQIFAFSRDGALPGSFWLYRMNTYTKTPVNTVWFSAVSAVLLGFLGFAGPAAIGTIFTLGVVALYIAYSIPIAARFIFTNDFKPGPFTLGRWGLPVAAVALTYMFVMSIVFLFPTSPQLDSSDMNYTVVVLISVLSLSMGWYFFPKYGGNVWFKGPIVNLERPAVESPSHRPPAKVGTPDRLVPVSNLE